MRSFTARYAAPLLALAALAKAQIVPTAPWGSVVCTVGQDCEIQWNLDTTGAWKDTSIFLNSGSNQNFVQMATVATGIDGTTGEGKYVWKTPEVTVHSHIYFFSFSNNGAPVSTWTTRFTIAAADGSTTEPENATQPDGSAVPWGVGSLVGGNQSGGGGSSGGSSAAGSSSAQVSSSQQSSSRMTTVITTSSSSNAAPTDDISSDETASTTVITVTPTTTRSTTSRTSTASPINNNASNDNSAAFRTQGNSVAGIAMALGVVAAFVFA